MEINTIEEDDWRLIRGQDEYLQNIKFNIKNIKSHEKDGIMIIANFAGTHLWKIQQME